ncbi:hypothetical protein NPX13_g6299 [Xylaria arbuscula]|uniref:Uncharacterized protein n=1 Tax=Xylaria arbuscula TaxID=114810 RepID=A0A9W8TMA1_9PEZI|nr:hypothetical protein NPX13_g6299 [Xylaria arbuscula]
MQFSTCQLFAAAVVLLGGSEALPQLPKIPGQFAFANTTSTASSSPIKCTLGHNGTSTSTGLPSSTVPPFGNTPTTTAGQEQTTITVSATSIQTIISCAPTVTNCPVSSGSTGPVTSLPTSLPEGVSTVIVTTVIGVTTTVCPVTEVPAISSSVLASFSSSIPAETSVASSVGAIGTNTPNVSIITVTTGEGSETSEVISTMTIPASASGYPVSSATETESIITVTVGEGSETSAVVSTITVPASAGSSSTAAVSHLTSVITVTVGEGSETSAITSTITVPVSMTPVPTPEVSTAVSVITITEGEGSQTSEVISAVTSTITVTPTPSPTVVTVTVGGDDNGHGTTLTMTVAEPTNSVPPVSVITKTVGSVVTETVTNVVTSTMVSISTVDAPGTCVCTATPGNDSEYPTNAKSQEDSVAADKYKLRRSVLY